MSEITKEIYEKNLHLIFEALQTIQTGNFNFYDLEKVKGNPLLTPPLILLRSLVAKQVLEENIRVFERKITQMFPQECEKMFTLLYADAEDLSKKIMKSSIILEADLSKL